MVYKPLDSKVLIPELEHEIQKFWDETDAYWKRVKIQEREERPHWSFIDGPITSNNPMGVHHAWGRTYKDLFSRFRFMRGYEVRNQNGFDSGYEPRELPSGTVHIYFAGNGLWWGLTDKGKRVYPWEMPTYSYHQEEESDNEEECHEDDEEEGEVESDDEEDGSSDPAPKLYSLF